MPHVEGLVQHLSLLPADGEAEVLGCIREAVDDVLYGSLRVDEKGAVVSKQQLSDEFLDGFRAFEKTSKVKETAVCSETDVDAVLQVLFCLTGHDAEEDGEQCGGQNASLLDAVGDGEAARQRPIVLHLTLLTFMELAEDGETAKARQDFPQSITAYSIKGLGQVYESCI